jgi:hypothetical protein
MKKLVLFVWIIFSFLPMEAEILSERISPGNRNFLAVRVEFQEDNTYLTNGNGRFMLTEWTGHDSADYVLDPLPHDRDYFKSHLTFISNYWNRASDGNITVNTDNAYLIPSDNSAYTLSEQMRYYSNPDSLDYRLARLVYESVKMAAESGEYLSNNDGVIIYHAGAGQDFKIDLDDSPFDIPSFYFDETYLSEYLPYDKYQELRSLNCLTGVVLPESQNQLGVDIALNGTEILLTGMLLGLPTLYDTEFGRSGAGIYGLMDQGSNTGSGLCPIKPSAFERYLLGAADPVEITESGTITLFRDDVYKLPITSNEYFLIEFRKNAGMWADSLTWARDNVDNYLDVLRVTDSLGLVNYTLENGVLTDLSDLDLGLPTDGILIWHVVEPAVFGDNPNATDDWFLNLVEADGGDDIGKWYNTFDPSVNNGWKWDTWFYKNPGYKENNPSSYKLMFNDNTHPDSRSKSGLPTGIGINDFKFYPDSVVLQIVIDDGGKKNFDGMVFDERTHAFDSVLPGDQYLAYRDSSLYLYDGQTLNEIYKQDSAYVKGQVALLSDDNAIIQITNGESNANVTLLANVGGLVVLDDQNTTLIDHPVDLEHIAIHGDSLFLPPVPVLPQENTEVSPMPRKIYKLDIPSWTLVEVGETNSKAVPYISNDKINYAIANDAAVMNGDLIKSEFIGFSINDSLVFKEFPLSYDHGDLHIDYYIPQYADLHILKQIIPLQLNNDGKYDVLALTNVEGKNTLTAFSNSGLLLNNYPIFRDYSEIRVYKLNGNPQIVAYDPSGVIDIYGVDASKIRSFPAPVNASSFFLEQVTVDSAWILVDGSIIPIASGDVYWGYDGKDAAHTNTVTDIQPSVPVSSTQLIKNGLIYNYPNPIEGERTKFRFFATGATHATVNIFALDGRFITKLEMNLTDQQWNEIPWFIHNETSGVYLAKIEITDGTQTETYFVKPAILK